MLPSFLPPIPSHRGRRNVDAHSRRHERPIAQCAGAGAGARRALGRGLGWRGWGDVEGMVRLRTYAVGGGGGRRGSPGVGMDCIGEEMGCG